jgi:hypothetical protein
VNVNSDRLEQDAGARNANYVIAVLEQFGLRLYIPGFIVSDPIFAIINLLGNVMGTVGGHEAKHTALLHELGNLKLKFCERQVLSIIDEFNVHDEGFPLVPVAQG